MASKHAKSSLLLRVQSPEGTKRVTVAETDSTRALYEKIHDEFDLDTYDFRLFVDRAKTKELLSTGRKSVASFGLRHGDMLFLMCGESKIRSPPVRPPEPVDMQEESSGSETSLKQEPASPVVIEDDVDVELGKKDGKIKRPRDPTHCRHGPHSQCVHCFPLDPWDEGYIKENGIKHMSFNAYLRKLQSGLDKGKFVALENLNCSVKPDCPHHPPWPKGLCSKCTPPAITLTRQKYRHIDHIMFENAAIVDRFLNYWRLTGNQRLGFLYGYHELHDSVPLGIRAVVVAIYEPPQESTKDELTFNPDPNFATVDFIASKMGLTRIGWIFTDLVPENRQLGTVQNLRNLEHHLLSAQEAITAAYFQNMHPNPCKVAREGFFGSKFVTVCVSGNEQNQIHLDGYQISDQGMGLVKHECIVPTKDIPQLAYVLESTPAKYVPDVFYRVKDKYGNHITKVGRPLPIEYLLLDVPLSTPVSPMFTFTAASLTESTRPGSLQPVAAGTKLPFPVENRLIDNHLQDIPVLAKYLKQFQPREIMDALSDLHVLVFLASCDTLPLSPPELKLDGLLTAVKARDAEGVHRWLSGDDWQTVEQLLLACDSGVGSPAAPGPSRRSPALPARRIPNPPDQVDIPVEWTCDHCTFINQPHLDSCEVCGLPKEH